MRVHHRCIDRVAQRVAGERALEQFQPVDVTGLDHALHDRIAGPFYLVPRADRGLRAPDLGQARLRGGHPCEVLQVGRVATEPRC